ncbi:MAG: hypothetical protein AAGK22_13805 [Acidobacteriota bacterium]
MNKPSRAKSPASLFCFALLLTPFASVAAQADEPLPERGYYDQRLREGSRALENGEADRAVAELRLACFGYLSEPRQLTPCLAKLALAQSAASKAGSDVGRTVDRLQQLEERFQTVSQGALPIDLHARLRQVLAPRAQALALAADSILLAESLPEPQPLPEPAAPTAEAVRKPASEVAATAPPASAPAIVQPMAGELPSLAVATLEKARKLYESAARISELEEALSLARTVADEHAESEFAQQLAAEIAFRASRFATALRYFERGMPLPQLRSDLRFYRAVSLYEVGLADAARRALEDCLGDVEPSPWVDEVKRRILDEPRA